MNIECEESFIPFTPPSSLLGGFTSESYERTFERGHVHPYQQNYQSNESSDKTTGNINRKTDQFIKASENTLEVKRNETQLQDLLDGNRSHGKLQKRRSRSKSTSISKGARRDREPSRSPWKNILNLFSKNKAIKRYVRSHIVNSGPHSSVLEKISSFDYCNYLKTRICKLVQNVQGFILLLIMFVFKTRTAKHKKTSQVAIVFHDEFVHVVQCYLIKCKKRNHKHCLLE